MNNKELQTIIRLISLTNALKLTWRRFNDSYTCVLGDFTVTIHSRGIIASDDYEYAAGVFITHSATRTEYGHFYNLTSTPDELLTKVYELLSIVDKQCNPALDGLLALLESMELNLVSSTAQEVDKVAEVDEVEEVVEVEEAVEVEDVIEDEDIPIEDNYEMKSVQVSKILDIINESKTGTDHPPFNRTVKIGERSYFDRNLNKNGKYELHMSSVSLGEYLTYDEAREVIIALNSRNAYDGFRWAFFTVDELHSVSRQTSTRNLLPAVRGEIWCETNNGDHRVYNFVSSNPRHEEANVRHEVILVRRKYLNN